MYIVTKKTISMITGETLEEIGHEYSGSIECCCGASKDQKALGQKQSSFFDTAIHQASSVFGSASTVFNDLVKSFSPIVEAGPSQMGFSAQELAAKKSAAISNVGEAYKHASQAAKEAQSAIGGGNLAVPAGAEIGANLSVANAGAQETARELGTINEQNWETGRENYFKAAGGLEAAPGVFGTANQAMGEATGAGGAAASTANSISQQSHGWMNLVSGALGGVTGALTGGMTGGLGGIAGGLLKGGGGGDHNEWGGA